MEKFRRIALFIKNLNKSSNSPNTNDREHLGEVWTDALEKFEIMLSQFKKISTQQRMVIAEKVYENFGQRNPGFDGTFFSEPSFEMIEELMKWYPGNHDAELLTEIVNDINRAMSEISFETDL